MTKWLHHHSFSYRKPSGVPHKYSAEAQQAFLETYSELKQKTGDDEPILFIDGVHPYTGNKIGIPMDACREKILHCGKHGSSRIRMNIMGAINLNDIGRTVISEYDTINAENIARFFIAIRETYPYPVKKEATYYTLWSWLSS